MGNSSRQLQEPLDAHIRAALSTRPDLLAKVAVVQAKEAQLRAARADLLPKLSLTGLAGYTRFDTTVRSAGPLEEMGFGLQNYGGFLTVQWPIFTGFGEENKVRLADTQRHAAVEETFPCQGEDHRRSVACLHSGKKCLGAAGKCRWARESDSRELRRFSRWIRSGAGAGSGRAYGASGVVSSHRAARGIGQRHRSDSRGIGFRFRQARSRYPPRPIATPVSSAPTSTIVHPSGSGRWPVLRTKI